MFSLSLVGWLGLQFTGGQSTSFLDGIAMPAVSAYHGVEVSLPPADGPLARLARACPTLVLGNLIVVALVQLIDSAAAAEATA